MFKAKVECESEAYGGKHLVEKILEQAYSSCKDGNKLRIVLEVTEIECTKVPVEVAHE